MVKRASSKMKQTERKKNLSLWDRFWIWVKVNEKLLMVILLLMIAPAFAFTGPAALWFSSLSGNVPVMKIYGEVVSKKDVDEVRAIVATVSQVSVSDFRPFFGDEPGAFGQRGLSDLDFILCEKEAEKLNMVVSDEELGTEIRKIYWGLLAVERLRENQMPGASDFNQSFGAMKQRYDELKEQNYFDRNDWIQRLKQLGGQNTIKHHAVFESSLRRYLKAQKVVNYAKSTAQVSEEDVFKEFQRNEQFRKVSFFEYKPDDELEKKASEGITQEDLLSYFTENRNSFNEFSPKLKLDYLYIPIEHFESEVKITDEDIQKEYQSSRDGKFRRGLELDGLGSFSLRTEKEEEEFQQKLYKPLEEVKEEVVEILREKKKIQLSRIFATTLKERIFPNKEVLNAADSSDEKDGEDASEKELAEISGATFDELAKEFPFIEVGSSPRMTKWDVEKELGKVNSNALSSLFNTQQRNAQAQDESTSIPLKLRENYTETTDGSGLVIYDNLKERKPGIPEFEDAIEEIREKFITRRALDLLNEKVEKLIQRGRDEGKTLEELASDLGSEINATAYLKKNESINLAVDESEDDKSADDDSAESNEKAETKLVRGGKLILEEAFTMDAQGTKSLKALSAVRNEDEGLYYILRLDGVLDPDPTEYPENQAKYYKSLLRDRQTFYFTEWRKDLWKRANVQDYVTNAPTAAAQS